MNGEITDKGRCLEQIEVDQADDEILIPLENPLDGSYSMNRGLASFDGSGDSRPNDYGDLF